MSLINPALLGQSLFTQVESYRYLKKSLVLGACVWLWKNQETIKNVISKYLNIHATDPS